MSLLVLIAERDPFFMNIDEEQRGRRGNRFFDFSLSGESSDVPRLVARTGEMQIHLLRTLARFADVRTYKYSLRIIILNIHQDSAKERRQMRQDYSSKILESRFYT